MSEPLQISVHVEEKRYQPTQEKTVVPGWDAKTVTPDKGYALSKVTVEGMPEPTETETFTENGEYNVGRIGTAIVDVGIELQDKTVTPSEAKQTVQAGHEFDGLGTVTVNPIPPEYVVPTGSVDITANGQGIDVAGKAEVNVNVPQGVFPSGTKLITQNVTGEDVTNFAAVDVAVPGPSGTKQISITANGTTTEDVSDYADVEITVNTLPAKGLVFEDYDADGYPHSARFVEMASIPIAYARYLFQGDCKIASRISAITMPEGVTSIGGYALAGGVGFVPATLQLPNSLVNISADAARGVSIQTILFGDAVESIGSYAFYAIKNTTITIPKTIQSIGEAAFQSGFFYNVIFLGHVPNLQNNVFGNNTRPVLYDFSYADVIPTLFSVASLGHANGCVIRIPAALSDTTLGTGNGWESATNWSALTDIVWEVV